ncbi:hypothetical protein D3C79_933110 [compost metagenome]
MLHMIVGYGQHNAQQRQAIAEGHHTGDPRAVGANHCEHRRAEHLEAGEAGGVKRHDLAAVVIGAQFVDP